MTISVHTISKQDYPWVGEVFAREWGAEFLVVKGRLIHPERLQGFYAANETGDRIGLVTYEVVGNDCEMVSLNAFTRQAGIGTALVTHLRKMAIAHGCHRLWLVTTNDNLDALRFYQRRGFHLAGLILNGIDEDRKLKPQIPSTGMFGIPLRDEIILEMNFTKSDEQR